MDLSDYLTFRATGDPKYRSICTTTCKWNLIDGKWDDSFWSAIGLEDLATDKYKRIGAECDISPVGSCIGTVCTEFGEAVGLPSDGSVSVAAGMIDAHAGALAMICSPPSQDIQSSTITDFARRRISLLCGTSACFMAVSSSQQFISGIWGPYSSALLPNFYLHEGGQSACGALLDHMIALHPAGAVLQEKAKEKL